MFLSPPTSAEDCSCEVAHHLTGLPVLVSSDSDADAAVEEQEESAACGATPDANVDVTRDPLATVRVIWILPSSLFFCKVLVCWCVSGSMCKKGV